MPCRVDAASIAAFRFHYMSRGASGDHVGWVERKRRAFCPASKAIPITEFAKMMGFAKGSTHPTGYPRVYCFKVDIDRRECHAWRARVLARRSSRSAIIYFFFVLAAVSSLPSAAV